jgi:nucleotide-binding universal stress UspA family protein
MNKILVPVDFSETSLNALYYAIQLFQPEPYEITVLHIFSSNPTMMALKNIDQMILEDSQRSLDKLMAKVHQKFPEAKLKPKILKDHAVTAIASLGDSDDFDFIVMGTKGASGLKEVFLGSVAGGVISKTRAPVIVVPDGHSFQPLEEIVIALSESPESGKKVEDPLRKIAAMHHSNIKALHIEDTKPHEMEKALADITDLRPTVDYTFGSGNTHKDMNDYLIENESEMLCMIRGKKGFFSRLFKESATLKETFDSPVPLLILHDAI